MKGEEGVSRAAGRPVQVLILALPETAGSALYGMIDVLMATGNIWQSLVADGTERQCFDVRVLSADREPFHCGHGIPVEPACSIADDPAADLLILPEIWLGPHESIRGRSHAAGYEDVSFFRRLFKRLTGLTPGEYRRMFQPLGALQEIAEARDAE